MSRAIFLRSVATESSRSRISPSGPDEGPLASLRSESPGTNRNERICLRHSLGFLRISAWRVHCATVSPRWLMAMWLNSTMPASGRDLLSRRLSTVVCTLQRVAVEHRLGEAHVGHAEIGDGGAERRVVHRDADHQAEREQAVDDALAELGLGGELLVEVQGLHVHGQRAEQHVVHFSDRARPGMVEHPADGEFLEIKPRHLSPREQALLARMDAGRPAIVSMPPQDETSRTERSRCAR